MAWPFARPRPDPASAREASLAFRCNVCGANAVAALDELGREKASCACGSTVRFRAVVAMLSLHLFGRSLPIDEWPPRPDIAGIELSGWPGYAERLASRVSYTNTYFDREPRLDITQPSGFRERSLDFLVSSDVFEHVEPPVSRAFEGARKLLKPGGLLVVTVPFQPGEATVEHFPRLHDWTIAEDAHGALLRNTTSDGEAEEFRGLRFHGGEGAVLEMRVFSLPSLIAELEAAGFTDVTPHPEAYPGHGVIWQAGEHVPVTAVAR